MQWISSEGSGCENDGAAQLQGGLLMEVTLAAPAWEDLGIASRIRHRPGVFGLCDDVG